MAENKSSRKPVEGLADLTDYASEDMTEQDMEDINRLLAQDLDLTRQDMTVHDFQSVLSRYNKNRL